MSRERIYKNRYLLIVSILILLGISLFFLIMNMNTPMMGEDFALISFSHYYEPVSIGDHISLIVNRIVKQACNWNIRIGEQITIIFCSIDEIYYYIGNTIISVLYVLLIPIYAFGRKLRLTKRDDIISIIMSFCLIMLFQPVLGEIFFWRAGSGNYLWAVFILLVFIIPLRMIIENKNIFENKKVFIVVHTLLGFFAGLTNENTVITFIVIYVCTIIYRIKKKQEVYLWIWSSFISLTAGFFIMIFAPSTAIRMQTYKKIFGIDNVSIKDYIYRALNIIHRFFTENACLVIILLSILVLYITLNYKKIKEVKFKKYMYTHKIACINIMLLLSSSLSAGALIGAPYIETRAFFLIDFFMMGCVIYFSIQLLNENNKFIKVTLYALIGILLLFTIKQDIIILNTYNDYNKFIKHNYNIIEEAKNNNESSVKISPYNYINNRILNTREDYLQSNLKHLEGYFGIKVLYSMEDKYLIDEAQLEAKYIEIMNGMDYVDYNQNKQQLKIIGWAAIQDKDSKNNGISILLKSDNKTYEFPTDRNKRKDVSEYYNNRYYDDTGFSLDLSDLDNIVEKGKYKIGICIKDNTSNGNFVMYTQKELEIN
ncbi:hypothetical protein CLPUN_27130 [Clostridium puniceum]|uniref:Glycosyltransferase RgtA/B/C/D-like domain-containing protein n=1 Tax=Clostridium puniceum TaxID=29367 RepID=A0A1S8TF75_9CLOT|nr:DUF6056 family protein [Clostridium puniceum]OOM76326.1 hypothetical protein CLPUN_27130 [Clostridium puniceum]